MADSTINGTLQRSESIMAKSNIHSCSLHDDTYDSLYDRFRERKKEYERMNKNKTFTWDRFYRELLGLDRPTY